MTVQIDDAGWGCLIGGVLIGAYRVETQEFVCGEIPVQLFQDGAFACKDYLRGGATVVEQIFQQLEVPADEPVEVCRGYVLDGIREWLSEEGYNWIPAKIEGPLQSLIEGALLQKLQGLGIKVDYETLTKKQGLLFWHCLRWLKGGNIDATRALPEREALAKTGWASYEAWVSHPYQQAKRLARGAKRAGARARRPW